MQLGPTNLLKLGKVSNQLLKNINYFPWTYLYTIESTVFYYLFINYI